MPKKKSKSRQSGGGTTKPGLADDFSLETQQTPADSGAHPARPVKPKAGATGGKKSGQPEVVSYRHSDKRKNNPEVGMVKPENDPDDHEERWCYDPHIDPALQFDFGRAQVEKLIDEALASGDQDTMRAALEELKRYSAPYLNWTGKAERTTFDVDTVSLHVHERIDPASILSAIRKNMKNPSPSGRGAGVRAAASQYAYQPDLFAAPFENLPLRDAIDFYKHERGWANRLIAGDSLLVMNSLLQKESMAGQVQMIYIDPPYGIKYGSNFQPFVNKRDVKDRKDEDLTQEPEMIKAFRDTWELGIHSYLTYLRDRLLLAKELLHESGSVFVQIGDENVHLVRSLMDEIFGKDNFFAQINFKSMGQLGQAGLASTYDYLIWYTKDIKATKFRPLYREQQFDGDPEYRYVDRGGVFRQLASGEPYPPNYEGIFRRSTLTSSGYTDSCMFDFELNGETFRPFSNKSWRTNAIGMERLKKASRLFSLGSNAYFKRFATDSNLIGLENSWYDPPAAAARIYVVETAIKFVERCILMTTDPGDLVLDPTCGSGTTAFVAEKWGRRWITCDTSRVSVTLAKQRLMTASYDYYELKYPQEGLKSGFIYKTVPHVTLKSIANNPEIDEIYERMHPAVEVALVELNKALGFSPPPQPSPVKGEGVKAGAALVKGEGVKVRASAGKGMNTPSPLAGEGGGEGELHEWEVPFDFPADWPQAARKSFDTFHAARQAMQKKMDDSIAAHADQETLYDQPAVSKNKLRITGPFTVEAVPFPSVLALEPSPQPSPGGRGGFDFEADVAIARSGESARQHSWRDELLKTGIRGKGGQMLKFADLETLPDSPHLHVSGHLDSGERVVVSFGPEHAALEQRQVAMALNEAEKLRPAPKFIIFASFEFDPEAAKDIDETKWPGVTLLKAKMNADLLTDDLKKGRASNQSFWLMGQPDVEVHKQKDGQYVVEVHGFDY
ncbi:MAG TPA: site-specific DNA-methyltransferase, partial [Candidatus Binatia bacterium]|nr:site-specific DNA-methyltransferase [Candidatus Binatia bacterium]